MSASSKAQVAPAVGATRVAPWKDDKKTAFSLMFDDSIPSDFQTVVPELQKRGLTATFYLNPGTDRYAKARDKWDTELPHTPGVVYGNHTMTHEGLKDFDSADADLAQVNAVILKAFPGKEPRLISFARPGVSRDKWTITDEDYQKVLAKNNLVARENRGLYAAQSKDLKTAESMLKIVDAGIADGRVRSMLFHGVGADWLITPTDVFTAFLDGLMVRKEQVWITDHISAHKYATESKSATVNLLEAGERQIRLEVKDSADAWFYDYPLTLITQVPVGWKQVWVVQGSEKTAVTAAGGQIQYEAKPNAEPIMLTPAA
jgi:peptidoglycan/xylan/chitin deacetylase (PgdA/CDA1 family)